MFIGFGKIQIDLYRFQPDRFIVALLYLDRFGYIWIHADVFLIVLNLSVPSVKIFLG